MKRLLRKYFLSFSSLIIVPLKGLNKIVSQFFGKIQLKSPQIKRGKLIIISGYLNATLKNLIIPKYRGKLKNSSFFYGALKNLAIPKYKWKLKNSSLFYGILKNASSHFIKNSVVKTKSYFILSKIICGKINSIKTNIHSISKFYIQLIIYKIKQLKSSIKLKTILKAKLSEQGIKFKKIKNILKTKIKLKSIVGNAKVSQLFLNSKNKIYARHFRVNQKIVFLHLKTINSLILNTITGNAKIIKSINAVSNFAIGKFKLGAYKKINGLLKKQKSKFFGILKHIGLYLPKVTFIIKNKGVGVLNKVLPTSISGFNAMSTLLTSIFNNAQLTDKIKGLNTTKTLIKLFPKINIAKPEVGKKKTINKITGMLSVNVVYSWEEPEQSGTNLSITQIFSGTQEGNILEIN